MEAQQTAPEINRLLVKAASVLREAGYCLHGNEVLQAAHSVVAQQVRINNLQAEIVAFQKVCEMNLLDADRYRALRDEANLFSYDDDNTESPWIVLGTNHANARPVHYPAEADAAVDAMIAALPLKE